MNANTLAGRLIRLPLRVIPDGLIVIVPRGLTKGMRWRVGASTHGCWLGTYESAKQGVVRDIVRPGMNVLDIGANAGFYTLGFSRLVGPSGHVWAIEPFAENVRSLVHHLALNRADNVTVIQSAVSGHVGMAGFETHESNSMGRLSPRTTSLLVPTVSIDALVGSTMPPPDLVKMDIEGGELAALQGAAGLLAMRRTTWLVALDDPATASECMRILRESGLLTREIAPSEIIATPG